MSRRLPPLKATTSFEAAARLGSFSKAAQELNVTQAAVSHQIKALEDFLGCRLFDRTSQGPTLTGKGAAFLPSVQYAFDQLELALETIAPREQNSTLSVTASTSFCAKWLIPRLADFRRQHPGIEVWLSSSDTLVDFTDGNFDLGIRFGLGDYPNLTSVEFMKDHLYPVCTPAIAEIIREQAFIDHGRKPADPLKASDLKYATLLYDEITPLGAQIKGGQAVWRQWFTKVGLSDFDPPPGPGFSHASLMIQAAIDGMGVALARHSLVADDIRAGRLVRLFQEHVPDYYSNFLVYPPRNKRHHHVRVFQGWLEQTAMEFIKENSI